MLKNQPYKNQIETLRELIDNSIAAKATRVYLDIDDTFTNASLEDDGIGFPTDAEGIKQALSVGNSGENTTDLNEHGVGFNASMAKFDPSDKNWKLYWKRNGQVYELVGCLTSDEYYVNKIDNWPGNLNGKSGSLILFPIDRKQFKDLYETKNPKMTNVFDILRRLRINLAHTWMLHTRVKDGTCQLIVNNEVVDAFTFPRDCDYYSKLPVTLSKTLISGCKVELNMRILSKDIKDSWYRKTQGASGFYIYKNGRFIKAYADGSVYLRLYGAQSHDYHNGFIATVNFVGTQQQSPPTSPAKNEINQTNDIFEEACIWINEEVKKYAVYSSNKSEDNLMKDFEDMRRSNCDGLPGYDFKPKWIIKSDTGFKSTQVDAYETIMDRVNIYEAKADNKVAIQHINQLFCNWVFSCECIGDSSKVSPILILDVSVDSFKLSDDLKEKIRVLASKCTYGFPLKIRNYQYDMLYEFKE